MYLVGYFVLGLLLHIIGLIIGLLWIKFKVKAPKQGRVMALVSGVVLFAILYFAVGPLIVKPYINHKFPEIKAITEAITSRYPDTTTDGKVMTIYTNGIKKTGLELTVHTKKHFSLAELWDMGALSCQQLSELNKTQQYNTVKVTSEVNLLPLELPFFEMHSKFFLNNNCTAFRSDQEKLKFLQANTSTAIQD